MPTDFITTSVVKAATRNFTAPIISAATFDAVIAAITGPENPLGTTPYQTAGQTIPGTVVTGESYRATIEYFDENTGSIIGSLVVTVPTREKYNAIIAKLEGDTALSALFGGDAYRNDAKDSWGVRVRLHDPTGEIYFLALARNTLRLSSFESDTILAKVEAWADSVPALA